MKISKRRRSSPRRTAKRRSSPRRTAKRRSSPRRTPRRRSSPRRRMRFTNDEIDNIQNLPDEMILNIINKLPIFNRIQLALNLNRPGLIGYNCEDYNTKTIFDWFIWILNNRCKMRELLMTNEDFIALKKDLSSFFYVFTREEDINKILYILFNYSIQYKDPRFTRLIPANYKLFPEKIKKYNNIIKSYFTLSDDDIYTVDYNDQNLYLRMFALLRYPILLKFVLKDKYNKDHLYLYPIDAYSTEDLKLILPYFKTIDIINSIGDFYDILKNNQEIREIVKNKIFSGFGNDGNRQKIPFKDKYPELYN